ncbi:MAG: UPF0182 family protein [Bacillota bacterium]|nr:UPF0182 family protein [Bacillota bacterium]
MKKKTTISVIVGIIIFALFFISSIVNFIINVKWYSEVGYLSVYFTKLMAILKLSVPLFLISFLGIWFYYKSIRLSIIKYKKVVEINAIKKKTERKIIFILDAVLSLFLSVSIASSYWYNILMFSNSVNFNVKDPIFGLDVSFFVFKLPLIDSIYGFIMSFLIFLIIITVVLYFILSAKDRILQGRSLKLNLDLKGGLTRFAGRQLAVVSSLILLFLSIGYYIKSWKLVYSPRGVAFGASYTDIHVTYLFYKLIIFASLAAAVVVFISVIRSKIKPIIISIVFIVGLIVVENVSAIIIQNAVVKSNEKSFEKPYIQYNIDYTRKAYNIDNLKEQNFNIVNDLTKEDIGSNKEIISNIKINSFKQSLEFYNQAQVLRYYYTFNDLDVDRYNINGKYTQVFIAPREINSDSLVENAANWQNKHLVYTHGYGVVMSNVNAVTSTGQPDFLINNIPPNNKSGISLTNPSIYYGEKTKDYAIVNTKMQEIDYPSGDGNKYTDYKVESGIKMTFLNRIMFAIQYKNINFLLSRDINSDSKILINRNIMDRVQKIAPFLNYDSDPYIVINNGQLYWIIDAYTTSDKYPYSQPYNGINYIRNSVKVVVNALNGKTDFYIADKNDPLIESYSKIFSKLFKSMDEMDTDLKTHLRYPEQLFKLQGEVISKYHMTDPGVFFNSEDLWQISTNEKEVKGEVAINDSSYFTTKLPGNSKEEMVLVDYFNMRERPNMVSMLGARMDGDNYGKLVLYRFPTDQSIDSPYLFKSKINQDTTISQEITLWNKEGSQVVYGDTIILPIKNSLLYIEPLYLRSNGANAIPEMKRVIMMYGDKIISAETIDKALAGIFDYKTDTGVALPGTSTNSGSSISKENAAAIKDLYDKAIAAQKNGDWASYGDYIKKLGDLINQLNK